VGAGWGGREGFPKEGCPVGDLLKIMGGPSYMGLHMLGSSYTLWGLTPKCNEPKFL